MSEKKPKVKDVQQTNNAIPLSIWEDFEDLYIIEKRKSDTRNLHKKDFFIKVFKKGVVNWAK
tara:strand:- start:37 stop:222 length:186 start_codon:yes stop_codon:yes gene_type:complete